MASPDILRMVGHMSLQALRVAEQLGPTATVVTVMRDIGLKYLHTPGNQLTAAGGAHDSR